MIFFFFFFFSEKFGLPVCYICCVLNENFSLHLTHNFLNKVSFKSQIWIRNQNEKDHFDTLFLLLVKKCLWSISSDREESCVLKEKLSMWLLSLAHTHNYSASGIDPVHRCHPCTAAQHIWPGSFKNSGNRGERQGAMRVPGEPYLKHRAHTGCQMFLYRAQPRADPTAQEKEQQLWKTQLSCQNPNCRLALSCYEAWENSLLPSFLTSKMHTV